MDHPKDHPFELEFKELNDRVEEMVDAANAPGQDAPAPSPETPLTASLAMGGDAPIARLFQAIRVVRSW